MNDRFDEIRSIWFSANPDMLPDAEALQMEIAKLRKQKKNRLLFWYSGVIVFSALVILYVIYTDELNSIYRSISEFILLFTSLYLFRISWKHITAQKREYLLSNRDFIESLSGKELRKKNRQLLEYSGCTSLLLFSGFLYFLNDQDTAENRLLTVPVLFLVAIAAVWLVLKPYFQKRTDKENRILASKINKLLREYN